MPSQQLPMDIVAAIIAISAVLIAIAVGLVLSGSVVAIEAGQPLETLQHAFLPATIGALLLGVGVGIPVMEFTLSMG